MGKHERDLIKEAEEIIVKVLNSEKITSSDRKNHWFKHAIAIARKIKGDFPNINLARHLGNRYDNTGDILIISGSKKFFIEIKMSDTKSGIGTKANISQDALTENKLFIGNIKSWSQFRRETKHDKWVKEYLDRFPKYKKSILKINNPVSQMEEKARYLRDLKKRKNIKAKKILEDIRGRDRQEKLSYLDYLKAKKQKSKKIKRFFILIFLGVHDKNEIEKSIKQDKIFREVQNLYVYYSNLSKGKITIREEDVGEKIKKVKSCSNFRIFFPENLTHCKIIATHNKKSVPLIQIVFHWKNIAQGIKTPCLNIFDITGKKFI